MFLPTILPMFSLPVVGVVGLKVPLAMSGRRKRYHQHP
jgi:hypothetical protein